MLLCVLSKNTVESPKSSDEKKLSRRKSGTRLRGLSQTVCEKRQKLLESPKTQSTLRIVMPNESSDLKFVGFFSSNDLTAK